MVFPGIHRLLQNVATSSVARWVAGGFKVTLRPTIFAAINADATELTHTRDTVMHIKLSGIDINEAIFKAHSLASKVICEKGALVPMDKISKMQISA